MVLKVVTKLKKKIYGGATTENSIFLKNDVPHWVSTSIYNFHTSLLINMRSNELESAEMALLMSRVIDINSKASGFDSDIEDSI